MSHLGLQILYAILNDLPEVGANVLRPLAGHGGGLRQTPLAPCSLESP